MSPTEEGQQQIIQLPGGLATAQEAIRADVKSLKEENAPVYCEDWGVGRPALPVQRGAQRAYGKGWSLGGTWNLD